MKSLISNLLGVIVVLFTLQSCKNDAPVLHTNISGKANDLLVVISEDSWKSKPGELIKQTFAQFQYGLPQEESLFDIINIPPAAFKNIFKSNRNILQVTISSTVTNPEVLIKDNAWAYPQAVVEINAQNTEQFEKLFNENNAKLLSYFLNAERKRITANYEKYYEKAVYNILDKNMGVTMKVPPGFVAAIQKEDFAWFRYETPEISQAIIVYTFPYTSDSTFTESYLNAKRDSVLKQYISSTAPGSYMTTEKRLPSLFRVTEHNKNYAAETRGLWILENDFMGGPYIALDELDAVNQRVVSVFGYVYAPSKDKRNYLQQVESMVYSLKMNKQAENDKINSQVKMGN
jgi:hypothetical protein